MMELQFFWIKSTIDSVYISQLISLSFLYSRVYDLRGVPKKVLSPYYLESRWFGRNRRWHTYMYMIIAARRSLFLCSHSSFTLKYWKINAYTRHFSVHIFQYIESCPTVKDYSTSRHDSPCKSCAYKLYWVSYYTALQNIQKSSVDLNGPPQRLQVCNFLIFTAAKK